MSSYWAWGVGEPSVPGLRAHAETIAAVAKDVLDADVSFELSDRQVALRHTFTLDDGAKLDVSSDTTGIDYPNPRRTVHVEGPADDPRVRAFADARGSPRSELPLRRRISLTAFSLGSGSHARCPRSSQDCAAA